MHTTIILLAGLAFADTEAPNGQELSVERAARRFRIETYDNYRMDRESYDHLREAGDELLANWRKAGQPSDYRHEVLTWFRKAAPSTLALSLPPIPDLPISVAPEPEATVHVDRYESFDRYESPPTTPYDAVQPITPLPIESNEVSSEVLFDAPGQADEPADVLPSSASAAPAKKDTRTLAEKWSGSSEAISTIGRFAIGVAGF